METWAAVVLGAVVLIAFMVVSGRIRKRKMLAALKAQWGKRGVQKQKLDEDALADIAQYWREKQNAAPSPQIIDDITWEDLSMDDLYRHINQTQSTAGEELLYAMLRDQSASADELSARRRRTETMAAEPEMRLAVQWILRKQGKSRYRGAGTYLFRSELKRPNHEKLYYALAAAPAAAALSGIFAPVMFFAAGALILLNIVVNLKTQAVWNTQALAIKHVASVLVTAKKITKLGHPCLKEDIDSLKQSLAPLAGIHRWNMLFAMERANDFDFITDYLKMIFLIDMVSLCRITANIIRHSAELNAAYALVGEIDASIAVANLKTAYPEYGTPEFHLAPDVYAEDIAHPLIENPVVNSVSWTRNALITGSNASGKSTFTKALAINAIMAQSLNICRAKRFAMPRAHIMSSMAIRDSILRGESYFIAEIKSIKRILDAACDECIILCFIDEILRGTNTIERIAASAALLKYMQALNLRCIAATHDIELTRMLAPEYDNYHFAERVTGAGMVFDYELKNGPSVSRNAIALLAQMQFPESATEDAQLLAARFDEKGIWERGEPFTA